MNLPIHSALKLATRKDYTAFFKNMRDAADIQKSILDLYLRNNTETVFGKKYGFRYIKTAAEFRKSVPVTEYEDYLPFLRDSSGAEGRALTAEKILLFEPTSGTSSGTRYIPYTLSLKREFRRAINVWLHDLYSHYPGILKGRSYWAISPVTNWKSPFKTDVPVGFEDDSEYLGSWGKIIRSSFAVPQDVRLERSLANFRYLTSLYLLRAEDLALISIWNPTFLLLILAYMVANMPTLIRDLRDGISRVPEKEVEQVSRRWTRTCFSNKYGRAKELESWYNRFQKEDKSDFSGLWPRLTLISCWQDAESRPFADKLASNFPDIALRGKGLLATEGIISFPLVECSGSVPAYLSHYLEFMPDAKEEVKGICELEKGKEYTVLLTTGGGLYRYNLHDRVRVRGYFRNLPILVFTGRNTVSDLVGEKLEELHLRKVLAQALDQRELSPVFRFCAPERTPVGGYYVLYIQLKAQVDNFEKDKRFLKELSGLRDDIEKGLLENYHYRYASQLGQLSALRLYIISSRGWQSYINQCLKKGQREGDIKLVLLSRKTGWLDAFLGALLPHNTREALV